MQFLISQFLQFKGGITKNYLLGVDIGSHTIKVVEFQDAGGKRVLRRLGRALTPEGCVEEGTIKDPAALHVVLSQLINNFSPKYRKGATSISGLSTFLKRIDVPYTTEMEIENNLVTEAEKHVPYDINEFFLDFHLIRKIEGLRPTSEIFLVAARKEVVNQFAETLQNVGITPAVVDVDPFTMSNAFEMVYGIMDETVALIDIGAQKSNINIVHKGESLFARDMPIGGNQLTKEIMEFTGLDFKAAERVKIQGLDEPKDIQDLGNNLYSFIMSWGSEFKKAIEFFDSNADDNERVTKVYLSGGCALMNGIDKVLSQALNLPVEIFDPFLNCMIDKSIDEEYVRAVAPQMTVAAGLASRMV